MRDERFESAIVKNNPNNHGRMVGTRTSRETLANEKLKQMSKATLELGTKEGEI